MKQYLKAEKLKQRHTAAAALKYILPGMVIVCALSLGWGDAGYYQMNQFNWWYTVFLPVFAVFLSMFVCQREKKSRQMLVAVLPVEPSKVWYAKIAYCLGGLITGTGGIAVFVVVCGNILKRVISPQAELTIGILSAAGAAAILVIVTAWQIPLWMFCYEKLGFAWTLILGYGLGSVTSVLTAVEKFWWLNPFGYGCRLMSAILHILPNNLPARAGSVTFEPWMLSRSSVAPAAAVSVVLFLAAGALTAKWYERRIVSGWER